MVSLHDLLACYFGAHGRVIYQGKKHVMEQGCSPHGGWETKEKEQDTPQVT
jgi:hypothetical protein